MTEYLKPLFDIFQFSTFTYFYGELRITLQVDFRIFTPFYQG